MSEKNEKVNAKAAEKTTEKVAAPKKVKKEAAPKVEILRGRMPLPIVSMIKFETEGMTDGAVAAKFRTTNGKVSDIRKDRNFGYITKSFVPTADMIAGAVAYSEQLGDADVTKAVKALKPSTPEQDAEFAALKASLRPAKKEAAKKPAKEATEKVSDDDLSALTA